MNVTITLFGAGLTIFGVWVSSKFKDQMKRLPGYEDYNPRLYSAKSEKKHYKKSSSHRIKIK